MNYWKSKLLPKIKKVFEKNSPKKAAAAAEASKAFDESKEQYGKEFEDKKDELQPKVIEIYEASSSETKSWIKEPKAAGLKKNSAAVQKFLDELVKIDFPGSKPVSEASSKLGPVNVSGLVLFIFEKISVLIPEEVKKEEEAPPAAEAKVEETLAVEEPKAEAPPVAAEAAAAKETLAAEPSTVTVEEKPATAADPLKG